MRWYETQIIGVIVGGLITMLTNWLIKWNENRIEKKHLEAGAKAEIAIFSKFIESGIPKIQKHREEFEATGRIPKLKKTGEFNFTFIDSNMSKIGVLDEELIKKIIELRGLKEAFTEGGNILSDTIILYNENKVDSSILKLLLTAFENSMKKMKSLSDEIVT